MKTEHVLYKHIYKSHKNCFTTPYTVNYSKLLQTQFHNVNNLIENIFLNVLTSYVCLFQPPTVHPINLVIEGSSMTILCIAMGTPMPTISLYISGRLVRQETTRHMVTVIHNVTRDMDQISCYADNGYGTPMQASRKITISRKLFL